MILMGPKKNCDFKMDDPHCEWVKIRGLNL